MSKKSERIATLIAGCATPRHDPHYAAYFQCFNQQLFYEAHDVLEELWLGQREGPNYGFYKGLIQLAGAFVHLQKSRLRPAAALFKLARKYFASYPSVHEHLDLGEVRSLIDAWLVELEATNFSRNPLEGAPPPCLRLRER